MASASAAAPARAFEVRPPRVREWAACRMLLPSAFRGTTAPHALLALDTATGAAIGCATFEHRDGAIHSWQARVVRPWRRRGIGTQLAAETLSWAAQHGATSVNAVIETHAEPGAEVFLTACGFTCRSRLFTVEADMPPLCDLVFRLRDRLQASGRIPPTARIVDLPAAPTEPLARLYVEHVAPALGMHPGRALPMVEDPRFVQSPVLLVDGAPEGMMLGEANDGHGTAVVLARVVSPRHRTGGWANLMLMAAALERGCRGDATRMRFEAPEDNRDTRALAERVRGETTAIHAWFVRDV